MIHQENADKTCYLRFVLLSGVKFCCVTIFSKLQTLLIKIEKIIIIDFSMLNHFYALTKFIHNAASNKTIDEAAEHDINEKINQQSKSYCRVCILFIPLSIISYSFDIRQFPQLDCLFVCTSSAVLLYEFLFWWRSVGRNVWIIQFKDFSHIYLIANYLDSLRSLRVYLLYDDGITQNVRFVSFNQWEYFTTKIHNVWGLPQCVQYLHNRMLSFIKNGKHKISILA